MNQLQLARSRDIEQDGINFRPISEGNEQALLQKAANGELVLYAHVKRHSATLHTFHWLEIKRPGNRITAGQLVPVTCELANDLLLYPEATLTRYLAADPCIYPETHPFTDHWWLLDEPQTVKREDIYFRCNDENVTDTNAPTAKVEAAPDAKNSSDKPLLQQQFQEQEILRVIRELKHDPKKLPKQKQGESGVKAEVRQKLNFSVGVFDKAWERLRASQDIQDA